MINENNRYRVLEAEIPVNGVIEKTRMLYIDDCTLQYKSDVLSLYPELHIYLITKEDFDEEVYYGAITPMKRETTHPLDDILLSIRKLDIDSEESAFKLEMDDFSWGFLEDQITIAEYASGIADTLEEDDE